MDAIYNCNLTFVFDSKMTKSMLDNRTPGMVPSSTMSRSRPPSTGRAVSANVGSTRSISAPFSKIPPISVKSDMFLIDKIRRERQELIKKGISLNDPLIVEIDKRLRSLRLHNI